MHIRRLYSLTAFPDTTRCMVTTSRFSDYRLFPRHFSVLQLVLVGCNFFLCCEAGILISKAEKAPANPGYETHIESTDQYTGAHKLTPQ